MSERKTNSNYCSKITRQPGESTKKIGSDESQDLLSDILLTTVNKQFFDSTFEQLMSSGSLEPIKNFVAKQLEIVDLHR